MSEKSNPFIRALSAFLVHKADETDGATQLVQDLVTAHSLNTEGIPPLTPLDPTRRKHIEEEIKKVNSAAKKVLKDGGGYVDFTQKGSGSQVQTLAEDVDRIVSGRMLKGTKEERAKGLVREILEGIAKKSGW